MNTWMKALMVVLILAPITQQTNIVEYLQNEVDTEYGQTLVKNIELQLESGAHVDDLTTSMRSVQGNLKQQLADGEANYDESRGHCSEDLAELNAGRTQAETDLEEAWVMAHLDSDTLESRQNEYMNKASELDDRFTIYDELNAQRDTEIENFEAEVEEFQNILMLLAQVREIVATKLTSGGDEFLQTTTSMSRVAMKLRSFQPAEKSYTKKFSAFFQLLAKLVEKSNEVHTDQTFVTNINSVVSRIEDNLQASQQSRRENEKQRSEDHLFLMDKISAHITTLQGNLLDLDQEIMTLDAKINASAERVDNAAQTHDSFVQRIDDREMECAQDQTVWENFYNNISAELSTASRLMYLLVDKHALLSRFGL